MFFANDANAPVPLTVTGMPKVRTLRLTTWRNVSGECSDGINGLSVHQRYPIEQPLSRGHLNLSLDAQESILSMFSLVDAGLLNQKWTWVG